MDAGAPQSSTGRADVGAMVAAALAGDAWQPNPDDDQSTIDPLRDPDDAAARLADRTVAATDVRTALLRLATVDDVHGGKGHRPTLHVAAASLTGVLDLADVTGEVGIVLTGCRLAELRLQRAGLRTVWLERCVIDDGIAGEQMRLSAGLTVFGCRVTGGAKLDHARVDGSVMLVATGIEGLVRMVNAEVGGQLNCAGAVIDGSGGDALNLDRASVGGGVFFNQDFHATGETRLLGARIGGQLNCVGGSFRRHEDTEDALSADGADIVGDVLLRDGFSSVGAVRLPGATVRGDVSCRGARLDGDGANALNLNTATISGDVYLTGGLETSGEVRMVGARVGGQLNCNGGALHGAGGNAMNADSSIINGGFFLTDGCTAVGEVRLIGARVGGPLICRGATLTKHAGSPDALSAHNAEITGGVFFTRGFHATGSVQLWGAQVRGGVHGEECQLDGDGAVALTADGAEIHGKLSLANARITGTVQALGAVVRGDLSCTTTNFDGAGGVALNLSGALITGSVFLVRECVLIGHVAMLGVRVGGALECSGASLDGGGSEALTADNADITGSVTLTDGFTATGEVRMLGARVGGQVTCRGATITRHADSGDAFSAHHATIGGDVFLTGGFRATGTVQLWGTTIQGGVHAEGARLDGDGALAFDASGSGVTGDVFMTNGFHATGPLSLRNARIGGQFALRGATADGAGQAAVIGDGMTVAGRLYLTGGFSALGEVRLPGSRIGGRLQADGTLEAHAGGHALSADNAEFAGDVWLAEGLRAVGGVRFADASIGGSFSCQGVSLRSTGDGEETEGLPAAALDLAGAQVAGSLRWNPAAVEGTIDLTGARVSSLLDSPTGWGLHPRTRLLRRRRGQHADASSSAPLDYRLANFTYSQPVELSLTGTAWAADGPAWRQRVQWLAGDRSGSLQPFAHLAEVYRLAGHDHEASHILYHGHHRAASPGRRALLWLVGYGYRPRYALLLAVALLLATWGIAAGSPDQFVPSNAVTSTAAGGSEAVPPREVAERCADPDVLHPCFSPFVYALETVVPLVDLEQRDAWDLDAGSAPRALRWWLLSTSLAGWAIALLLAAGFTRTVRKD